MRIAESREDRGPGGLAGLILAGGSGTRFWPLSRRLRPKQLLALEGGDSLLQATVSRLSPLISPDRVWVCTTEDLAEQVRSDLPEVKSAQVLCEPMGRNTAPAIGWSLMRMKANGEDPIVAVLPADHRVEDHAAFRRALETAAAEVRRSDRVMTLGVKPARPETGYGYLEVGEVVDEASGAAKVVRFTEKPDMETARGFVAGGRYLWNAGIFVFRCGRLLDLLAEYEPEIAAGLAAIEREPDRINELYAELQRISIDYGVMERCEDLATLPLECGWSDLGSWQALAEVLVADADGNRIHGDVIASGADGNLLWADRGTIAVAGVEGLAVVRTGDAVLVVPLERSQEVKELVDRLAAAGRDELL